MTKLTARDTRDLLDVVRIGDDLILLPHPVMPSASETIALIDKSPFGLEDEGFAAAAAAMTLGRKIDLYGKDRRNAHGIEPGWARQLTNAQLRWVRWLWAIQESDSLAIVNTLPNTGIAYMVEEGGLCETIEEVFGLRRLQGIAQLGYLQPPWIKMSDQSLFAGFTHNNRYVHSLDVMVIATLIAHNLGITGRELNTIRIAAFTHDWGTPAGGDSVKLIDPEAFDEDENYERLLCEYIPKDVWRLILRCFGIRKKKLYRTILNQGILGEILDIADKLAYVARDMDAFQHYETWSDMREHTTAAHALKEIAERFPLVCGVWDSIRREGERLVFTDTERLIAFLKARVILFRELYYHPHARYGEYLVSRVLVKQLYDQGRVTKDRLLHMDDGDLRTLLQEEYGEYFILQLLSLQTRVEVFPTKEAAEIFQRDLRLREEIPFSLLESHRNVIKSGASRLLVDTPTGPKPLNEACPGEARELEQIGHTDHAYVVYYAVDPDGATHPSFREIFER